MRNTSWSNNNWPEDFGDIVEPTVERRVFREVTQNWWEDWCRMSAGAFVGSFLVCWSAGVVGVLGLFRLGLLALVLIAVAPSPATAEGGDSRWIRPALRESARWNCEWLGNCYQHYRYLAWRERQARLRHYRQPVYHREATLHYRTPDRDRHDDRRRCRDAYRTVGNQHIAVAGAKGEADKAWIQAIRFHYGEVYMALENAKGLRYTCSRSSVGETLGQTFNRCELEARPCRAEKEEGER